MIMSELRSLPVTPKLKFLQLTRPSKVIPELHSGQKVTAIGIPPTMSFTIGDLIIAKNGYKMLYDGMPSLDGPPDNTSAQF